MIASCLAIGLTLDLVLGMPLLSPGRSLRDSMDQPYEMHRGPGSAMLIRLGKDRNDQWSDMVAYRLDAGRTELICREVFPDLHGEPDAL